MPQFFIDRDPIRVATSDLGDFQKIGLDQFRYDFLNHSLSDSHQHGDFTQRDFRIPVETEQNVSVVREKRPASRLRRFGLH